MISVEELRSGDLELVGSLPWASNFTYLARLDSEEGPLVVYKPQSGEAPLWDFDSGSLCRREVAGFQVSEAAGWRFVPPTALRQGPLGLGAVQAFVDHDPQLTAFDLAESHPRDLRSVAVFDLITNNADRKAGHVFLDTEESLWVVDHGLCFHIEPKLRTILWDFVGEPIPESDLEALSRIDSSLDESLCRELESLLTPQEIEAFRRRAQRLLEAGTFPPPGPGRPYPWPPV